MCAKCMNAVLFLPKSCTFDKKRHNFLERGGFLKRYMLQFYYTNGENN